MGGAILQLFVASTHSSRVAVIHLSQGGSFLREGLLVNIASILRIKTIAHVHGSGFDEFAKQHPRIVSWALFRANKALFLSSKSLKIYEALRNTNAQQVVALVNNIVEVPSSPSKDKSKKIIFAGEVGHRKGADLLLKAWGNGIEFDGWELQICGPITEEIQDLISQTPAAANLKFTQELKNSEVKNLLLKSLVAVLPSRAEAQPMFVLEAMAAGCCVIASDVGNVSRMIDDDSGVLIPHGDLERLHEALLMVTQNITFCKKAGQAAREIVERQYGSSARLDLVGHWLH
jgi:glycosyltransferase involved in cell wall biosynthesis